MGHRPGGPGGPGRGLDDLGLSDDQKAKVQELMKATHERVRKETEAELQKILTPEQWQRMQESHGPRGHHEGGPGVPK
jgi:Spy/CpxP family protein refolding chaperone